MLWRWAWVILIAMALSGGTAFLLSRYEKRYYIARTSLQVSNSFDTARPDANTVQFSTALGNYYAELARRERILKPVQESLGLSFPWQIIADEMLKTNVNANASLLEITITDTNPERAAAIANAIDAQLIAYAPTSGQSFEERQKLIDDQMSSSNARMSDLKQRITDAQQQQQQATSASDLTEINSKIAQLEASLEKEQEQYNSLVALKTSSATNSLTVFEPAAVPQFPLPSKRNLMIAIAMLVGFLISVVAIVVLDRLDSRWRSARDAEYRFRLRPLGDLPKGPPIIASLPPLSTERHAAVRAVQSNILLAAADRGIRTLLVTSPIPSLDRTALAIDLANLFARSGQRVLLVDADPIKGELTSRMHAAGDSQPWSSIDQHNSRVWTHLVSTPLQNVALLPAGGTDGEPAMLSSPRWLELSSTLAQLVDIVIFDGPSTLVGPDAALLAPHVDGVVLVLDPAVDSGKDVNAARSKLVGQSTVRLLGAVMSRPGPATAGDWRLPDRRNPELPGVGGEMVHASATVEATEIIDLSSDDDDRVIITPAGDEDEDLADEAQPDQRQPPRRAPRQQRSAARNRTRRSK